MSEKPHPAAIAVGDDWYLRDAKGSLVPIAAVKAADLLMDELVRTVVAGAGELSAKLTAFKADTFDQVAGLQALLAQQYGASVGGVKGNITLLTFDGCQRVQVQVSDLLDFGPELQAAKALIDECLIEWSEGSPVELKAIVNRAFAVDKAGQINRAGLFMLLRTESTDERWLRAMDAIKDSIRSVGKRTYVRFYQRDEPDGAWRAVPMDLATA